MPRSFPAVPGGLYLSRRQISLWHFRDSVKCTWRNGGIRGVLNSEASSQLGHLPGKLSIGLLEEQSIIFRVGSALADDHSLCLACFQGFEQLHISEV